MNDQYVRADSGFGGNVMLSDEINMIDLHMKLGSLRIFDGLQLTASYYESCHTRNESISLER